jgi:hypothetical protein
MQYPRSPLAAIPTITIVWLAALALGACDSPTRATAPELHASMGHAPAMHATQPTGDAQRDIARLRERTAQFNRFEAAVEAGWSAPIPGCFADPQLGGMGFHYGNPDLIDGTVDALEPELLVYEPQKNGRLRFVAVEYIVPFTEWTGAEPPELYGQSFHRNESFGIWVLHVWHMRENPQGIFVDWNPKVSCQYAQ